MLLGKSAELGVFDTDTVQIESGAAAGIVDFLHRGIELDRNESSPVEVPHRTGHKFAAHILGDIYALGLIHIPVLCEFVHKPPVHPRITVDVVGVVPGSELCIVIEGFLEFTHIVLHICELGFIDLIRVLELPGHIVDGRTELVGLVEPGIHLHQVSALDGCLLKLGDIHAIPVDFDLLAEIVVAFMLAVEEEFYEFSGRGPGEFRLAGYLERDGIADESPVHPIGEKTPSLVFLHPEYLRFAVKFECVRLLGELGPGAVPTPFHA